nr:MAG TPA: hypothetical protein [Caudoviricetes sp.]
MLVLMPLTRSIKSNMLSLQLITPIHLTLCYRMVSS